MVMKVLLHCGLKNIGEIVSVARGFVAVPLALMELPLGSAQAPLPGLRNHIRRVRSCGLAPRRSARAAYRQLCGVFGRSRDLRFRTEVRSTLRWREMDSNFRFPDAPSGRSAESRTFSSDREFAPLAWRDRDFERRPLARWISALERGIGAVMEVTKWLKPSNSGHDLVTARVWPSSLPSPPVRGYSDLYIERRILPPYGLGWIGVSDPPAAGPAGSE